MTTATQQQPATSIPDAPRIITSIAELQSLKGERLGTSPWLKVEQPRIDAFATCTEDFQWIHLDRKRAATESPFGDTIAHGYLTLALIPALAQRSYRLDGFSSKLNYGLNKVRFIQPVPQGSRIRAHFIAEQIIPQQDGRYQLQMRVTIEVEGQDKPACVAETLALLVP